MNITTIKSLGIISGEDAGIVKFLLLEDGALIFGKCYWHKDLVMAFYGKAVNVTVLAAGVLPRDVSKASLDEDAWGGWLSNGYNIVTPQALRLTIKEVLTSFESEINRLWEGV
jgi:hypothetical protein